MANIIIHKSELISDYDALRHVLAVIHKGRISDNGRCYCYVSQFTDGFYVYADRKKSDIFTVTKYGGNTDENQT